MEEDSRKNEATCEDRENNVRDKTLYGNVFHRNVCWQRSYQKPKGEELIIALYLGTTKVDGYALYSLGPYPGIYPLENSCVLAEVRRFSGKQQLEIAKSIDYMELFGGYHREYVDLEIGEQKFRGFIYVYDEKPESERIEHGDWARYLNEKELQERELQEKELQER
mgnify:CR=1 FL=1